MTAGKLSATICKISEHVRLDGGQDDFRSPSNAAILHERSNDPVTEDMRGASCHQAVNTSTPAFVRWALVVNVLPIDRRDKSASPFFITQRIVIQCPDHATLLGHDVVVLGDILEMTPQRSVML